MAKRMRVVAEAIRSAPGASGLGQELERRVEKHFGLVEHLQDEALAIMRQRRSAKSEGAVLEILTPQELAIIKAADESGWKGAAILERVGAAALASQHGSEEKINAILANVRKLIKKGKPKQ